MIFVFYRKSGELHAVHEDYIDEETIDPATGVAYSGEWEENFKEYSLDDILCLEKYDILKYLSREYPKDLINAIKEL